MHIKVFNCSALSQKQAKQTSTRTGHQHVIISLLNFSSAQETKGNSKEEIARLLRIIQDVHKLCSNSWRQVITTFYLAQSITQNLRFTTSLCFNNNKKTQRTTESIHPVKSRDFCWWWCFVLFWLVFFFFFSLISRILIKTWPSIKHLKLCKWLPGGHLPNHSSLHQAESEVTARYQLQTSFLYCTSSFSVWEALREPMTEFILLSVSVLDFFLDLICNNIFT